MAIDFKKRLKDLKDLNPQMLLDLPPGKPKEPAQSEMIACQCCGHTWKVDDPETIRKSWKQFGNLGPLCDICWMLHSVRLQAHVRGLSLKTACWRFLKGQKKRLRKSWEAVWEEKS